MKSSASGNSKKRILLLILVVISVAGLAYLLRPQPDPLFQGKLESEWIADISSSIRGPSFSTESDKEWAEFGPEGVRVLIRGLENATHPLEKSYRQAHAWMTLRIPKVAKLLPNPPADGTRDTRQRIARLLSKLARSDKQAASAMTRCLDDEDAVVRESAFALFTQGEDDYARLNQIDEKDKRRLLSYFIEVTEDPESPHRTRAVCALGYYPKEANKVVPALVDALGDMEPTVSLAAVLALQKVASDDVIERNAVPALINLLKAPDDVAYQAARLLGEIKMAPALSVPALTEVVQGSNGTLFACSAVIALSHFEEQSNVTVPVLQKVAARDDNVGRHARDALKHLSTDTLVKK